MYNDGGGGSDVGGCDDVLMNCVEHDDGNTYDDGGGGRNVDGCDDVLMNSVHHDA